MRTAICYLGVELGHVVQNLYPVISVVTVVSQSEKGRAVILDRTAR